MGNPKRGFKSFYPEPIDKELKVIAWVTWLLYVIGMLFGLTICILTLVERNHVIINITIAVAIFYLFKDLLEMLSQPPWRIK